MYSMHNEIKSVVVERFFRNKFKKNLPIHDLNIKKFVH